MLEIKDAAKAGQKTESQKTEPENQV